MQIDTTVLSDSHNMHNTACNTYFEVHRGFCRSAARFALQNNNIPLRFAAAFTSKLTHNTNENHETLIGFYAADKAPPF